MTFQKGELVQDRVFVPVPTICPSRYSTALLCLNNPFYRLYSNCLSHIKKAMNFLHRRRTQEHILRKVLYLENARRWHFNFAKTVRVKIQRQGLKGVDSLVCGFVNRSRKILEHSPHSASWVEVQYVAVVNF